MSNSRCYQTVSKLGKILFMLCVSHVCLQYLARHGINEITRDHFSFSAKIRVGNFYEAREGPEVILLFIFCSLLSFQS